MNNTTQWVKVGALKELTASNFQCDFKHIVQVFLFFDRCEKEKFFEWLEKLATACL